MSGSVSIISYIGCKLGSVKTTSQSLKDWWLVAYKEKELSSTMEVVCTHVSLISVVWGIKERYDGV